MVTPRYVVSPGLRRFDRAASSTLADRRTLVEIDGESVPLVRAVLDALRVPADVTELRARVPQYDADEVDGALELLLADGYITTAAPVGRVASLATGSTGGVTVVGIGAAAAAIATALRTTAVNPARDVALGDASGVVVSVSSQLLDPRALAVDAACRSAGRAHVPVILDGNVAHIGPLAAPFVSNGPCARCALLRLLALRDINVFHLWRESLAAEERGELVIAPDTNETFARAIAVHTAAFLAHVADDGGYGGKQHALIRVDAAGLVDAHRVRRHSSCGTCSEAPPRLTQLAQGDLDRAAAHTCDTWRAHLADESESLPPARALVEDFADPVTGLISLAEEWDQRGSYFGRFPVMWGGMNLARETEWVTSELQGINGTGPTIDHRRLVCVSEGAERYGQHAHVPAVTHAPWSALRAHAIDPRDVVLYTDDRYREPGFPRPPFDPERPQWWSWAYSLSHGRARLVPSELVVVNVGDDAYPERLVDQRLTSGGASHTSWHRALVNGMRELIERDAHMIAWYKRIPLARVELPARTGDAYADDLLAFLSSVGLELRVYDLRIDFPVPTYLMVARLPQTRGSWEAGGTVFVAVADLSPIAALSRGLCETALHYETLVPTPHARKDWRNNPYDPNDPAQGWRGWWPTYMHYLNPHNTGVADFYDGGVPAVPLASIASLATGRHATDVDVYVSLFRERGMDALAVDLVNAEIADLGFRVTKVVVPGLVELTPAMQGRRLRSPRLDAIAAKLGRGLPAGVLHSEPHPNA